jgi:5-formyltetrahydrofolate cyclo-ligase
LTDASPKASLRAEALARRTQITAAEAKAFGVRLAERGATFAAERGAKLASAFWAIADEVPTLPLLEKLAAAGIATALPVMCGFRKPLEFRQWVPGAPLAEAKWGIMEPVPAPEVFPDLLFVPLLAFDRGGNRLGYGAGFYDRTLAMLRGKQSIITVGVGFAVQEFPAVPADAYDEKLDYVLTDCDWIICGAAKPAS